MTSTIRTAASLTVLACVAVAVLVRRAEAQFGLVSLPLGDPAYVQLQALERQGCAAARVSTNRPYEVRRIRAALRAARGERYCNGPILTALARRFAVTGRDTTAGLRVGGAATLRASSISTGEFLPLWENIRPTTAGDPPAVGVLQPRVTWSDGRHVAAVIEGIAETSARNDPTFPADQSTRSTVAFDVREAYVVAGLGAFTVMLGRDREAWLGEGIDSYALSANGPPITHMSAGFQSVHWEGHAFYGLLNDVVLNAAKDSLASGFGPQRFYRYLAAHELTWRPSRVVELTVGETAVFSRGARTFDFNYVNPLLPYLFIQHDSGRTGDDARDNLLAYGGVNVRLGPATLVEELYIDDIQIDSKDRRVTPDLLGWRLATEVPIPIIASVPLDAEIECRHSDSYLYMRRYYMEVQQYWNEPIGSELGPDADEARVSVEALLGGAVRLAGDAGLWRRGLLRIDTRPAVSPVGKAGTPYPSLGVGHPVQRARVADLSVGLLSPVFPLTLSVAAADVTNANNVPAPPRLYAQLQVTATYRFRYP